MPNPPESPSYLTQATRQIAAKRSPKTVAPGAPLHPTLEAFQNGLDFNENREREQPTDGDPILGYGW